MTVTREQNEKKEKQKKAVALAALEYIAQGGVIGIGSGSTVNCFIEALAAEKSIRGKIDAVVAASLETEKRIRALSIPVEDLNSTGELAICIDGADEVDDGRRMIKGGGGALTREKILATASKKFICLIDQAKQVSLLGAFPVAVEVIPMARSFVARKIVALGGRPVLRENFVTDNGNPVLDVYNLKITSPLELEEKLNNIPGVVGNGIFAARKADVVLVGTDQGILRL